MVRRTNEQLKAYGREDSTEDSENLRQKCV